MNAVKRVLLGLVVSMCLSAGALAYAGAINGPQWAYNLVNPMSVAFYQIPFEGGQQADIWVEGNGQTNLDIYVYDQYGFLISWDKRDGDYCEAHFWVPSSQVYSVHVVNRGLLANFFTLFTS